MLLEIAVADGYGIGYEYVSRDIIQNNNDGRTYIQHPVHSLKPGQYSDDTQMSIGLTEFMIDNLNGNLFDEEKLASYFFNAFKRDPRKGYSRGFQVLLEESTTSKELLEKIKIFGKSDKNGGAMRVCPVGLLNDIELIKSFSKFQAEFTHEGTGATAAQAAALSVYWFRNRTKHNLDPLWYWLNKTLGTHIKWSFDGSEVKTDKDLGLLTVRAALDAACNTTTFQQALIKSISYGGDTDTVAAIVGGIVSCSTVHNKMIPTTLYSLLENQTYGRDYLELLDKRLLEKTSNV